jgi:crossover junction endodeoxyribonuclease RuvC
MNIIGIDPGKSGAVCMVCVGAVEYPKHTDEFVFIKLDGTEKDIYTLIDGFKNSVTGDWFAYIENVHSMPKQGVVSAFSFGRNFGFLIGLLTALKIPYEFVSPQKWQKAMGCLSKGDKNVTKAAAQRLFPDIKITHSIADALLIAEYGRRTKK